MNTNKTTIITGATGGIGGALAKTYFDRGHNLVLTGRNQQRLDEMSQSLGGPDRVLTVTGDLRDLALARAVVDRAVDRFGGSLANLINNAGTFLVKPFLETGPDDLAQFQDFFAGVYFLTQAAVAQMRSQAEASGRRTDNGAVIFISTIFAGGFIPSFPCSAVGASKAGYAGFTRNASYEMAQMGIRVNTLELGVVETAIYGMSKKELAGLEPLQPLNINGQPEDVARAVAFVTEESPFLTGQVIAFDGGVSAGLFCAPPTSGT